MNTLTHTNLTVSHPALDRLGAALENLQALLHLVTEGVRSVIRSPIWGRIAKAVERANQRRFEALIRRDPRISHEIRVALLRRDWDRS